MIPEVDTGDIRLDEADVVRMSPRQHEVLQLTIEGLSNREIADKLGNSVKTVEGHRRQLLLKAQDFSGYSVENRRKALVNCVIVAVRSGAVTVASVPEEIILTRREVEVAAHLVSGEDLREISNALFIHSDAVEIHLRNIYRKIGIQTRAYHPSYLQAVAILAKYTIDKKVVVRNLRGVTQKYAI